MQKGKFILAILILFIANFSIAQSQNKQESFCCNIYNDCDLCDVFIIRDVGYNKLVYKTLNDKKNNKRKNKQEYCYFNISNDFLYPFRIRPKHQEYYSYGFIVTNKNIIIDFLLPFFPDNIRNEILYNYSDDRDTIFKNLIEYEHKIIVDDNVYYYPLRDTTLRYAVLSTYHFDMLYEFINLLKKENILKDSYLINIDKMTSISIYIPLN